MGRRRRSERRAGASPRRRERSRELCYCGVMTRDEIIDTIRNAAPALKAEGVTKLAIFGSRARNDARPDSDLDVLVEVEPDSRFSMLNLIGVEHIIRDATGLAVQATMRRSLEPRMAERIADDIIEVF
jgi:uncharacterized protein